MLHRRPQDLGFTGIHCCQELHGLMNCWIWMKKTEWNVKEFCWQWSSVVEKLGKPVYNGYRLVENKSEKEIASNATVNENIPLPTPFSVILSPIHIRKADPAVSVNTTIAALTKFPNQPYALLLHIDHYPCSMFLQSSSNNQIVLHQNYHSNQFQA